MTTTIVEQSKRSGKGRVEFARNLSHYGANAFVSLVERHQDPGVLVLDRLDQPRRAILRFDVCFVAIDAWFAGSPSIGKRDFEVGRGISGPAQMVLDENATSVETCIRFSAHHSALSLNYLWTD